MLKNSNISEPPVPELVNKITDVLEGWYKLKTVVPKTSIISSTDVISAIPTIQGDVSKQTIEVLNAAKTAGSGDNSSANGNKLETEEQAYMKLKQLTDVPKAIAYLYAAQCGRDETMGLD